MEIMKEYDVVVIGSGCGMIIVNEALSHGAKVALVDKGPRLGGTCLNYGCIPSKMLIHPADHVMEIRQSSNLGIHAEVKNIDFDYIMNRMRKSIDDGEREVREGIEQLEGLDFYRGEGRFVEDYTLEVNGEKIKGDRIFIASGARPLIPPIEGLDKVNFLTNESALELKNLPESLIIIGGGYIGVEFAHFFDAVGSKVHILEMADRLILSEDHEMADLLLNELRKRMDVSLGSRVTEIQETTEGVRVTVEKNGSGKQDQYDAQMVMVALGRKSNADLLKLENTGVELDEKGFIKVDKYFETAKKNIFAVGDANGEQMFTHAANMEAALVIDNVLHDQKSEIDRNAVPHAVYSYPQIASVGMTEQYAEENNYKVLTGKTFYSEVAMGEAMQEENGFAKAVLEEDTGKILGFHIVGPYAPVLIQEVINTMSSGGTVDDINRGIHIHPSISELIPVTLNQTE
jgi:mycothione reductase